MPRMVLIPTALNEHVPMPVYPEAAGLTLFVVENAKSARAALKKIIAGIDVRACEFIEANEHTDDQEWGLIGTSLKGRDVGVLSEAGIPCVADPGSRLVRWAHDNGYTVLPLVGPNAMIMALAASGLCGQRFSFHGYLPRGLDERRGMIKALEKESRQFERTQLFIEAPHHNVSLFVDLMEQCHEETLIGIARDLTGPQQLVATKRVRQWRQMERPLIDKIPTVFLIQAMPELSKGKR